MISKREKLHALTSLRFFAAAMIVFHHLNGHMQLISTHLPLCHALTFFFSLSGFILYYSYPKIDSWEQAKQFYVARFARIWPAHFTYFLAVCIFVGFGLIGTIGNKKIGLLNLLMLHAWIPSPQIYFSFNSPSWSISTEFFFYLCFPLIIYNWESTWKWKSLLILSLPLLLMSICVCFAIPNFTTANSAEFTNHGFLYINPLARIPEFFLGMVTASFWIKYRSKLTLSFYMGSAIEMISLSLLLIVTFFYSEIMHYFVQTVPNWISHEFNFWAGHSGIFSIVPIVLLIATLANSNGILSYLLSNRYLVLLGEISFSIYLSHYLLLNLYQAYSHLFESTRIELILGTYLLLVLCVSYCVWAFVEQPMRIFLNKNLNLNRLYSPKTL